MTDFDHDPRSDDLFTKNWAELRQLRQIALIMEKHPEATTIREGIEREAGQLRHLSLDIEVWLERMREAAISLRLVIATGLYPERGLSVIADDLDTNADVLSALVFMLDDTLDDAGIPGGVLDDVAAD